MHKTNLRIDISLPIFVGEIKRQNECFCIHPSANARTGFKACQYIEHLTKDTFLWDTPHVLIIPYFNKENVYAGVEPACSLFSAFTDTRKSEKQR